MRPLVSVIVLSYNRPLELAEALQSLEKQSYSQLEILVVDNASEQTEQILRVVRNHPQMQIIRNRTNLGFTGGMNAGIALANGEYVFLTEDDIILDPRCITHLVDYMEEHSRAGLASGLMYNKGNNTIRCAGGSVALGPVYKKQIFGAGEYDTGQFRDPYEVDYIPGAFIMARWDVLRTLGGFRDSFFMYFEDTDLCLRARSLGYRIAVVPDAKVHHWDPPWKVCDDHIEGRKFTNFLSIYTLHAQFRVLPEFFLRYVVADFAKTLLRDPNRARILWNGLWRYLPMVPALLRERNVW